MSPTHAVSRLRLARAYVSYGAMSRSALWTQGPSRQRINPATRSKGWFQTRLASVPDLGRLARFGALAHWSLLASRGSASHAGGTPAKWAPTSDPALNARAGADESPSAYWHQ